MKTATVLTYGCSHNQKDSQLIEAQLINSGYSLVDEDLADLVVVNTCTVKQPTENRIISKLDELVDRETVVVTGCLSQASPELIRNRYPDYLVMGVNAAPFIIAKLNESQNIRKYSDNGFFELPVLGNGSSKNNSILKAGISETLVEKPLLESTQWNPNLNIIQINEGCLNSCTFCATKIARGRLQSFSPDSIITSIRKVPAKEVWLTSQDTGCYGFDKKYNIATLLNEIDKINRLFWTRVGMGNPNNFIKVLDESIEAFKSDKVYKFLHLPVQSGSNQVLKHMKRGYTVEEYEEVVSAFRAAFPELTLSTDVIVGYPTETEDDFEATLKTVRNTRPSISNISRFWSRKGTPAAELKQLSHQIRKERAKILSELTNKIQMEDNLKWNKWKGKALIVDYGPKGGLEARNLYYKPIIVEEGAVGDWISVEISSVESTYFKGEVQEIISY
jgi:threonylcarbamoyladenosine tRNA methylthiotransferase CDKAL1